MESSHYCLIFLSNNKNTSSQLSFTAYQTLHLEIIRSVTTINLREFLDDTAYSGFIFDGIENQDNGQTVLDWARKRGLPIYVFKIGRLNSQNKGLLQILQGYTKTKVTALKSTLSFSEMIRQFFTILSPYVFQDPKLASQFYYFKDLCKRLNIPFIIISGACTYIYGGKRSLKDVDVCVASKEDLKTIAKAVKKEVSPVESSCARTYYLNLKEIDVNAEIEVLFNEKQKSGRFDFAEIQQDAREVTFLGEKCLVMSPEMLILFKLALGRLGTDDFSDYKDDYEDARGVFISQPIKQESLHRRAEKMGLLDRIKEGERTLGIKTF